MFEEIFAKCLHFVENKIPSQTRDLKNPNRKNNNKTHIKAHKMANESNNKDKNLKSPDTIKNERKLFIKMYTSSPAAETEEEFHCSERLNYKPMLLTLRLKKSFQK